MWSSANSWLLSAGLLAGPAIGLDVQAESGSPSLWMAKHMHHTFSLLHITPMRPSNATRVEMSSDVTLSALGTGTTKGVTNVRVSVVEWVTHVLRSRVKVSQIRPAPSWSITAASVPVGAAWPGVVPTSSSGKPLSSVHDFDAPSYENRLTWMPSSVEVQDAPWLTTNRCVPFHFASAQMFRRPSTTVPV